MASNGVIPPVTSKTMILVIGMSPVVPEEGLLGYASYSLIKNGLFVGGCTPFDVPFVYGIGVGAGMAVGCIIVC